MMARSCPSFGKTMRRPSLLLASAFVSALVSVAPSLAWASDGDNTSGTSGEHALPDMNNLAANLDSEIRRAQALRADGKLTEAGHVLAQLVLVAPDDARVVGEYGKTLAEEGRGEDAAAFLERAIEINRNEWTYFSALGVAYDETGKSKDAALAYKHALMLKPGDASVLNNMALSRMLSGDLAGAHEMILEAKAADANDEKIARNLALVESRMAPMQKSAALAPAQVVVAPKQSVESETASVANEPAVTLPTKAAPAAMPTKAEPAPVMLAAKEPTSSPVAVGAPRVLSKDVVMEQVPTDPLAGPIAAARPARHHAKHRIEVARHVTTIAPSTPAPAPSSQTAQSDKKAKIPALRMSADAS